MHKISRRGIILLGAAAGLVATGGIGVLAMTYAGLPVDAAAWGSLAGAAAWGMTTAYFLDGKYEHPTKGGTRGGKLAYAAIFFIARSLMLTVPVGFGVGAFFFLLFVGQEIWSAILRFFHVTPPEVSANIVVGVLGTIGAIVTFFGARSMETRRQATESRRPLQRELYPKILESARRVLGGGAAVELTRLQQDAVLVASQSVLDQLAEFAWLASRPEQGSTSDLADGFDELVLAMRADLGFRDDAEDTNVPAWRDPNALTPEPVPPTFFHRVKESL